jgi:hypothetical protein
MSVGCVIKTLVHRVCKESVHGLYEDLARNMCEHRVRIVCVSKDLVHKLCEDVCKG